MSYIVHVSDDGYAADFSLDNLVLKSALSGLMETAATLQKEASLPLRPSTPPPVHPSTAQRPVSLTTPKQVLSLHSVSSVVEL